MSSRRRGPRATHIDPDEFAGEKTGLGADWGSQFVAAIDALSVIETQKARTHHAQIMAIVAAHRDCAQFLDFAADPAAIREHGPQWRGDTWVSARQVLLAEYAPACRLSVSVASRQIDEAIDAYTRHPDAVAALLDEHSGMSPLKLGVLVREAESLGRGQCARLDARVLPHAADDNSAQWRRRIRQVLVAILGEPLAAKVRRDRQAQRYVAISPDGQIAYLLGELPLAQAQAFSTALDDLARDAAPGDRRTHEQRRADALLTCVLGPAAFRREPGCGPSTASWDEDGQYTIVEPAETEQVSEMWDVIRQLSALVDLTLPRAPQVNVEVTVPIGVLTTADALSEIKVGTDAGPACEACGSRAPAASTTAAHADAGTDPDNGFRDLADLHEVAMIDGLGPIDAPLARQLAHDARWRRVVNDPATGIVYDVGTARYRPPADMRRRVVARDGTCRFPGCVRQAISCHLDHVTPFPGGPTADRNLIALCEFHHRIKHHTTWRVVLHHDGRVDWTSPTGRRYTTYPINRQAPPGATAA